MPLNQGRVSGMDGASPESKRNGNWEIYVMNADGSGQTNLTGNPAFDKVPDWSP